MSLKNEKKVLVIAYCFPPFASSAVYRPLKFLKYCSQFGWKPYVLTPFQHDEPSDVNLLKEIPSNVYVQKVFSFCPQHLKNFFLKQNKNKIGQWLIHVFIKFYSWVYYRCVTIDWFEGWILEAIRQGQALIQRENIDLIYVHGQPHSAFVVGWRLKLLTGKPLIMDYDDSWTTHYYAQFKKISQHKKIQELEEKILQQADAILSAKEKTINKINETFKSIDVKRFFYIPNGYDKEDFSKDSLVSSNKKLTILYTGKISNNYCYSPESFFSALGQLIKDNQIDPQCVSVQLIGLVTQNYQERLSQIIKANGLDNVVSIKGFLPHRESLSYLMKADLLLLMIESIEGNHSMSTDKLAVADSRQAMPAGRQVSDEFAGSLPAKMFEYMATGKPILAIVPKGVEEEILKLSQTAFITRPNRPDQLKVLLNKLYQDYQSGNLQVEPNWKYIEQFERKYLVQQMCSVFDQVFHQKRNNIIKQPGKSLSKPERVNLLSYSNKKAVYDVYIKVGLTPKEQIMVNRFFLKKGKLLDLACGTGRSTIPLSQAGFDVVGIDLSQEMIACAKKHYPLIYFRVMDMRQLEFDDETFDYVFCPNNGMDCLYPLSGREKAFKEIYRVLKKGGLFIFSSHNANCLPVNRDLVRVFLRNLFQARIFSSYRIEHSPHGFLYIYYGWPWGQQRLLKLNGFKKTEVVWLKNKGCLNPLVELSPYYVGQKF